MDKTYLLTVEYVAQAGDDLLITPSLSADEYEFGWIEKIKIVTSDNQVIEKDTEISIPLGAHDRVCFILIPNTQKVEVPIGSQIWIKKSVEENTSKPDTK